MQYDRVMYLLNDTSLNRSLIHTYVDVLEFPDGEVEIRAPGCSLPYTRYDRLANVDQGRSSTTSGWGTRYALRK